MRGPQKGDIAPDFVLRGVPSGEYRLSDQRGRTVVLVFYPGDFTPVCTRQLASYARSFEKFEQTGALMWGVSVDDLDKHERFAKARELCFPLLSDPDGAVSRAYGALGLLGRSRRSTLVVDPNGVVSYRKDEPLSLTYRGIEELIEKVLPPGE